MASRNSNRNESTRSRSDTKPYKVVYGIVQREGMEKSFWTRIGAAFENRDGSLNIRLDFLPRRQIRRFRSASRGSTRTRRSLERAPPPKAAPARSSTA